MLVPWKKDSHLLKFSDKEWVTLKARQRHLELFLSSWHETSRQVCSCETPADWEGEQVAFNYTLKSSDQPGCIIWLLAIVTQSSCVPSILFVRSTPAAQVFPWSGRAHPSPTGDILSCNREHMLTQLVSSRACLTELHTTYIIRDGPPPLTLSPPPTHPKAWLLSESISLPFPPSDSFHIPDRNWWIRHGLRSGWIDLLSSAMPQAQTAWEKHFNDASRAGGKTHPSCRG